jgi:anti-repressor protein
MSKVIPFKFNTTEVRVIEQNNEPMFVAKDVAELLGYSNPLKAIRTHCKGVTELFTPTAGGQQEVKVIPERDVYRLIMRSKMPEAEKFEDWVVSEVLPSIRKTGTYQSQPNIPKTFAESLRLAANLAEKLEAAQPKIAFADAVNDSINCVQVGDFAKSLNTGRNRLFNLLRDEGYLMAGFGKNNIPYQKYIDSGLFRQQEKTRRDVNGEIQTYFTTLITAKGQFHIQSKFFNQNAA